jgi:hypothetical protein
MKGESGGGKMEVCYFYEYINTISKRGSREYN